MSKKQMWVSLCWIILGTVAFYLLAVLSLWFIYSMGTMVSGGAYTLVQARSLVLRMALVTTSLTVIGVLCVRVIVRATPAEHLPVISDAIVDFWTEHPKRFDRDEIDGVYLASDRPKCDR